MKLSNHSGLGRKYEDEDEGAYVSGSGSHGALLRMAGVIILGYILSFIGSCGVLIILTSWLNSTNRK